MTLYKAICLTCFLTALLPAGTEALELCGKPAQGEILKGYAPGAEKRHPARVAFFSRKKIPRRSRGPGKQLFN